MNPTSTVKQSLWLLLCLLPFNVFGADLVHLYAVSDRIICIVLDEGHVDYYGEGQSSWKGQDNHLYFSAWDSTATMNPASYRISSPTDGGWATAQPIAVGRNSRINELMGQNIEVEMVMEHHIYLELPQSLIAGQTYRLQLEGIADNYKTYEWIFDTDRLRSASLHVNQIGFAPVQKKIAYLSKWMGDMGGLPLENFIGQPFYIKKFENSEVVYEGQIEHRASDDTFVYKGSFNDWGTHNNATHADVAQMDFSALSQVGEYVVVVPNIGCSYPFEIQADVHTPAFYAAMKGLFYQRSNIVQELSDGRLYPRDHHPDDYPHYFNPNLVTNKHADVEDQFNSGTYPLDYRVEGIWGWYHDASDWDCYVSHFNVPISLMMTYLMAPAQFYDGEIGNRYKLHESDAQWIDEGNNGLPDILDEAKWLLDFGYRARRALMDQGYGTGGLPGYIGREGGLYSGGLQPSWKDNRPWAVTAENPAYTMAYAASAIVFAESLNAFHHLSNPSENHPDFQKWVTEAEQAYAWVQENGGLTSGSTSLQTIAGMFLYKNLGIEQYQSEAIDAYEMDDKKHWHIEAANLPYIFLCNNLMAIFRDEALFDAAFVNDCLKSLNNKANYVMERTEASPMRYGGFSDYGFDLGKFGVPKVVALMGEHVVSQEPSLLDAIGFNLDYVLGGHELNKVFLSQVGENPQNSAIHHMDSWVLYDHNSMVYTWEILEGFSTYFGSNSTWVGGIGSHIWALDFLYPHWRSSPRAEANINSRESINGSEYTLHQTIISWAITAGYAKAVYGTPQMSPAHRDRPTVALDIKEGEVRQNEMTLKVRQFSPDTREVAYYYDWHFIGKSTDKANNFALDYDFSQSTQQGGDNLLITAVATDNTGLKSSPSSAAEKHITLAPDEDYLYLSVNELVIQAAGDTLNLDIYATQEWEVVAQPDWLNLQKISGAAVDSTQLYCPFYQAALPFTSGEVIIKAGNIFDTLRISYDRPIEPKAYWPFDGNSDDVLGVLDGINSSGVTYISDAQRGEMAVLLEDDFIELMNADTELPKGNTPRSFALWLKRSPETFGMDYIFSYGIIDTNQDYILRSQNGNLRCATENNFVQFDRYFPFETWVHLVVTYDGRTFKGYTNGDLQDEQDRTMNTLLDKAFFGRAADGKGTTNIILDDAMLFDYALSADNVRTIFEQGLPQRNPVTGVHIVEGDSAIDLGSGIQLHHELLPENADFKMVRWETSNEQIASVNPNGWVVGVGAGDVVIKLTSVDGGFTDTINIHVKEELQHQPYLGTPMPVPGKVEAEHYDLGGQGIAYLDHSSGNFHCNGRQDDVDLQTSIDDGTCNVGWTVPDEWIKYTINVTESGRYNLKLRVASPHDARQMQVYFERADLLLDVPLKNTGGWQTWDTVLFPEIDLLAGKEVVELRMGTGGFNLNYFEMELAGEANERALDKENPAFKVQLFPNPARARISVFFKGYAQIILRDFSGRLLREVTALEGWQSGFLPSGQYLVEVHQQTERKMFKAIVL